MTPKEIAKWFAENGCLAHGTSDCRALGQAYLALESRIAKLEAVAEAAKDALDDSDPMFRTTVRLKEALAELER